MAISNESSSVERRAAPERVTEAIDAERMRHDAALFDDVPELPTDDLVREASAASGWAEIVRQQASHVADLVVNEVREHPVRSMLLASAIGYLIATSMRSRVIPALLRSGAGIAAAMVMREITERGFGRLGVGAGGR